MSGKPAIELYHYDTKENGYRYLGKFISQVEVFKMYYDGKKGRLFNSNPEYRELPDGTYVTKERAGRNILPNLIRKYTDPLNWKKDGDKVIELFNDLGEKIGELANHRVLEALTNCSSQTLKFHLVSTSNIKRAHFGIPLCKFKETTPEAYDFTEYEDREYLDEINRMSSDWASGRGYI